MSEVFRTENLLLETVSLAEAAKIYGTTPKNLRNKLARNENDFGAIKVLGRWRVYKVAVQAALVPKSPSGEVFVFVRGIRAKLVPIPD